MQNLSHLFRLLPPLLALSFVTNLSILISPLFMMQVLDRVIPSGNQATLVLLGALATGALLIQTAVEAARDKSLGRIARWVEKTGTSHALASSDPQTRIEQVAKLSQFLSGAQAVTVLNLPWLPLLALILMALHPAFLAVLTGLLLLSASLRAISHLLTQPHEDAARHCAVKEQDCLTKSARNHGRGAGTAANLRQRFAVFQSQKLDTQDRAQNTKSIGDAASAMLRQSTQIIALGLGAFLVTQDALSAGGMIAGSLLLGKTFGTTEAAITQLPAIRAAFSEFKSLRTQSIPSNPPQTAISELDGTLKAEKLIFPSDHGAPPRLDRVSFVLEPGQCMVIAGASGSGKTTLLKALAGIIPCPIGAVYLDESEMRGLSDQDLFQHVGYLPQLAPILPGTIAENISCFSNETRDEDVVAAAKITGMHGLISALPNSYESDLEKQPFLLSAGQKQRLALARAIFNTPRYLFLDEPNALLDAEGERALFQTLTRLKDKGTTIVMVLHRSGVMALADKVLRLEQGRMVDFGDRGEVLGRMATGQRQVTLPLLESSAQDLCDWVDAQFNRADDADFSQRAQIIATELFAAMRLNGPSDKGRLAQVGFTFHDDISCSLTIQEQALIPAPQTLARLKQNRETNPFALKNLGDEEKPLGSLLQMAEGVEDHSTDETTCLSVRVIAPSVHPARPMKKTA